MLIHGALRKVDEHFTDIATDDQDRKAGDEMAFMIGDTFIDFHDLSPQKQWVRIMKALRAHGFEITPNPNGAGER